MGAVGFCMLAFIATIALSVKDLSDVFKVDDREFNNHPSSCNRYFDPSTPANSGSEKILNKIWDQLNEMNDHTVQAVSSAQYNEPENWVTRRIVGSFFAIEQNQRPDGPSRYEFSDDLFDEPMITYRKKVRAVRDSYKIFRNLINTASPDTDEFKPKLFCDSTFMELQTAGSNALDKDGKAIPIKDDSGKVTGQEKLPAYAERKWAHEMGDDVFAHHWFFWYDFKGDSGYIVLEKRGYPEISNTGQPFPLDPRTGQSSYCADTADHKIMATTLIPMEKPGEDSHDSAEEAPWHQGEHIILCPRSFQHGTQALANHPPAPYTPLNELEIVAMTLYHEIFHIVDLDNDDQHRRGPRHEPDGNLVQEWWKSKDSWNIDHNAVTIGAWDCLNLAAWERAAPETESFEAQTTKNCESFAWASFALNIMRKYQMDCSTGECEPVLPGAADLGLDRRRPNTPPSRWPSKKSGYMTIDDVRTYGCAAVHDTDDV